MFVCFDLTYQKGALRSFGEDILIQKIKIFTDSFLPKQTK